MNKFILNLEKSQRIIETFFKGICISTGFALLILLTGNVLVRIFPIVSLHWFDEIVELLFAWLVFLGSAVLFSQKDHFMIEWLGKKSENTRFSPYYKLIINLICLSFVTVFMYQGMRLTVLARDWTAVVNLPRRVLYVSMPISGLFMVYANLVDLLKILVNLKKPLI
jgi:TRAP-type C4-dicarboxylate transport system permease small subunit